MVNTLAYYDTAVKCFIIQANVVPTLNKNVKLECFFKGKHSSFVTKIITGLYYLKTFSTGNKLGRSTITKFSI